MANTLAVPIDIKALVVSRADDTSQFGQFENLFETLASTPGDGVGADLSTSITPQPFAQVWGGRQLGFGAHLHWALPDALTRGETDGAAKLNFMAAPDRWLVARTILSADGSTLTQKAWIVESDRVWWSDDESASPAPDPEAERNASSSFAVDMERFTKAGTPFACQQGRVFPLEGWAEDPAAPRVAQHTAIGYGVPEFAAVYGHSRNVFGFWDTATDLDAEMAGATHASYLVLGWHKDIATDPLASLSPVAQQGAKAYAAALAKKLKWAAVIDADAQIPQRVVYQGALHALPWSPDQGALIKPITPTKPVIAVGNTTAQAMSAYVASLAGSASAPGFESLLDILQLGLLPTATQTTACSIVDEARHQAQFQSVKGGSLWTIKPIGSAGLATPGQIGTGDLRRAASTPIAALPAAAGDKLNELNAAQAGADEARLHITALRSQLFADWQKVMMIIHPEDQSDIPPQCDPQSAIDFFEWMGTAPLATAQEGEAMLSARRDALKQELEALLPAGLYALERGMADSFWQANDPVLVLADPALALSPRWGGDGRLREDGLLDCRVSDQALIALQCQGSRAPLSSEQAAPASPLPSELAFLSEWLREAIFLDPSFSPFLAAALKRIAPPGNTLPDAQTLSAAIETALSIGQKNEEEKRFVSGKRAPKGSRPRVKRVEGSMVTLTGEMPSPIALESWTQPFLPVAIEWSAQYWPDRMVQCPGGEEPGGEEPPANPHPVYGADFISSGYALSPDDTELVETGGGFPPLAINVHEFTGAATLSQRPDIQFKSRLNDFLTAHPDFPNNPALIAAAGESFNVISQSMRGFNNKLLMRESTLQMPIGDPLRSQGMPSDEFLALAAQSIGDQRSLAPWIGTSLNGIRTGRLLIDNARVVDAFGQTMEFFSASSSPALVYSESLPAATGPSQQACAKLPPRVSQPARLNLKWRAASNGAEESNSTPLKTPIFGWALYNHVDDALAIYSADGLPVGSFARPASPMQSGKALWQEPPMQKTFKLDPNLELFCRGVREASDPAGYLGGLLDCIERASSKFVSPRLSQSGARAILMSRPLALARVSVGLELYGPPALDQGWGAFADQLGAGGPKARSGSAPKPRYTGGFEHVAFAARLGDLSDPDDSVIGFFKTGLTPELSDYQTFHSAAGSSGTPGINASAQLSMDFSSPEQHLTVLMDPRGSLGATTGILPVKTITIPTAHYAEALDALAVSFTAFPILSPEGSRACSLPIEAGFEWAFIERSDAPAGWQKTPIKPAQPSAHLGNYPLQLAEGWLNLEPQKPSKAP